MYSTLIFNPLYNVLVYLVGIIPGGDIGIAVIILTILLRIVLLPLAQKAQKTQAAMRVLQPELDRIKKEHKDNPQAQMQAMSKLYKEAGVNPFASIGLLLIQLPILIGLYHVFSWGNLMAVDMSLLYSFVTLPAVVGTNFLGLIDMYGKSLVLALLAGVTQYAMAHVTPALPISEEKSFANDFAKSMQMQMKYVFPALIAVVAYTTSSAIALYLIVSNLATVAQEVYNKRSKAI